MTPKKNTRMIAVLASVFLLTALLTGGCQERYVAPATDFNSDSFTERDRSESDQILNGIKELHLEDAQKIALLNNPNYISAYYAVNAARMRYYQAFATYMPQVSSSFEVAGGETAYHHQNGSNYADRVRNSSVSGGLTASLLVFDGFSREFGVMVAKYGVKSYEALNDNARRQLLLSVTQAYYDILLAVANRRIALENMSYQLANLRQTEIKEKNGAAKLSEVLNFQILVNQADSDRLSAEYNYAVALYSLAALMGYPEGTLPSDVTFPEIKYESDALLIGVDVYLDMALANRPDLRSYREQLKISEFQLYQTYSAFSPTVNIYGTGNVGHSRAHGINDHGKNYISSYNSGNLGYGVQAEWVIFNGFARYNKMREARANLAQMRYAVADGWLTVVNEVRSAYSLYDLNIKQANLFSEIRRLTYSQRNLVQVEYDVGQTEIVRLNEAQRDVVSAEMALAEALANAKKARAQLEAAANVNNTGRDMLGSYGAEATRDMLNAPAAPVAGDAAQGTIQQAEEAADQTDGYTPSPEVAGPEKPLDDAAVLEQEESNRESLN